MFVCSVLLDMSDNCFVTVSDVVGLFMLTIFSR